LADASSSRGKRAVAASRVVADDDEIVDSNYGLRLTQALEAISAAEARSAEEPADYSPAAQRRFGRKSLQVESEIECAVESQPKPAAKPVAKKRAAQKRAQKVEPSAPATQTVVESAQVPPTKVSLLQALDKLPPIRLPIGPAIPWRIGLPALIVLLAAMAFMYRPSTASEDRPGVRLPAQETYAVQSEAPLFASARSESLLASGGAEQQAQAAQQPIGVAEPSNAGMDALDVGLKLVAVLALAYGSLMLLKRFGSGGGLGIKTGGNAPGVRVVTSLNLGQNRSVHVIKVTGGKTLLVGATPTQVNLIADLGDVSEDDVQVDAASFFDVLSGKLPRS